MRKIRVEKAKVRKLNHIKINRIKPVEVRGKNMLNKVVSTDTLFKSNADYFSMNYEQQREYINQLSKEFIASAKPLLESLKDK